MLEAPPKIRVLIPDEVRAGGELRAEIVLDCAREVEVEHVDVTLEGIETSTYGSGNGLRIRSLQLLRLEARPSGRRLLPKGRAAIPMHLAIPEETPASFRAEGVSIVYTLRVHVPTAAWREGDTTFVVRVLPPDTVPPETVPSIYATDPDGPRGQEAHVELSLLSTWARPGDVLRGAFALANVAHNRYSEVEVGLVGERLVNEGADWWGRHPHARHTIRMGAKEAREGEMIAFRVRLPDDIAPDYGPEPRPGGEPGLSALEWSFEIRVCPRAGTDLNLRVPFRVLPASSRPGDAPPAPPLPTVGTDPLHASWTSVGAPLGLRYDAQTLAARFGETDLVIGRDHPVKGAVHGVAEIRYPDLFLDLVVEPASVVRKVIGGGVRVGDAKWDRDHFVGARDEAQAAGMLRAILPALRDLDLQRLDDRSLVVTLKDAGERREPLARFASGVVRLTQAIEAVRVDLPPPTGLGSALADWRDLARTLNAPLETARMRIAGRLAGYGAEARLSFDADGRPLHTWLLLRPSAPIDDLRCLVWRSTDGPADEAIAARFDVATADLALAVCENALELRIEPEAMVLCLPAPLGVAAPDGRVMAGAEAMGRLESMAQIASLLRGDAGPYR